jgi:hypothetical protein
MKYNHGDFTEARAALHEGKLQVAEATQKLEAIQREVKRHFLELAERFNYSFCFDDSTVIDPIERYRARGGRVRNKRYGDGTIYVNLPEGIVWVSDPTGDLANLDRMMKSKGIANHSDRDDRIQLDLETASERLEEILREYRLPGSTLTERALNLKKQGNQADGQCR